ncbi:MAG: DUF4340 domain-containing protein [Lentimicrobiaceae bacterium]|jgi:hypothetical protein|nr:DUF4340 domain-containing protein [Lentimicrobiaceae bacterium]
MKKNRTLIITTIILAVVAVVLIWNNRYLSTIDGEAADFRVYDTASVTKIYIANLDTDEVLLERQDKGWMLNNRYQASQEKINQMLGTMMRLQIRNPVSISSHNNVVSRLSSNGVKVEVYQIVPRINLFEVIKLFPHEKCTKVYYVGDATKDNMGTYMLKEGADKAYVVYIPRMRGFLNTRYTPLVDDWRDHTIFKEQLADIHSLKVELNDEPTESFIVENTGRHLYTLTRLANNFPIKSYDTLSVLNLLTSFSDIRFEESMNRRFSQETKDSITSEPFLHRITLTTNDGRENVVTTFKKMVQIKDSEGRPTIEFEPDLDRLYALVNNNEDFVLIQYYVFDKLLRPLSYYEKRN